MYWSGNKYERFTYFHIAHQAAMWLWVKAFVTSVVPQAFWFRRCRTTPLFALSIGLGVLIAINLEQWILWSTSNDMLQNIYQKH